MGVSCCALAVPAGEVLSAMDVDMDAQLLGGKKLPDDIKCLLKLLRIDSKKMPLVTRWLNTVPGLD